MSENSSKPDIELSQPEEAEDLKPKIKWSALLLLPVWTYVAFLLAQAVVAGLQWVLLWAGLPLTEVNQTIYATTISAIVYVLAVVIVAGVPYWLWRRKTTKKDLGVADYPAWMDVFLTIPSYVVYMILSMIVLMLALLIVPDINIQQQQQLPFDQSMLGAQWQYILAFLTLVVIAPLAEEVLFRGYLYGKLRKVAPVGLAVIATSLIFAFAHLWAGPGSALQWVVAIDTLALSIVLSLLREYTGAVWASVLVHSLKNGIAFFLLFVGPQFIEQLLAAMMPML